MTCHEHLRKHYQKILEELNEIEESLEGLKMEKESIIKVVDGEKYIFVGDNWYKVVKEIR